MRTTNDKKDYNLRIRLNDRMFDHLAAQAGKRNESLSSYVRDLIDRDIFEKNLNKKSPMGERTYGSDIDNPDSINDSDAEGR